MHEFEEMKSREHMDILMSLHQEITKNEEKVKNLLTEIDIKIGDFIEKENISILTVLIILISSHICDVAASCANKNEFTEFVRRFSDSRARMMIWENFGKE